MTCPIGVWVFPTFLWMFCVSGDDEGPQRRSRGCWYLCIRDRGGKTCLHFLKCGGWATAYWTSSSASFKLAKRRTFSKTLLGSMSSRHAGAQFIDPLYRVVDGPALWKAYCEGLKAQGLSVDIIPVDKDDWCWSSQNGMAHCMCTKTILVEPSLLLGIRWWVRWSRKWVQRWYSKVADARFSTAHTHRHTRIQKQRHAQGRKNACRRVGLAFIWSAVIVTC